jgi:nucleoside-diphosphate-sugar epimerase
MGHNILVIGASGQIGSELTLSLRRRYGNGTVIASDIKEGMTELMASGPFEFVDATDKERIQEVIQKHQIKVVYLMAAMLSASAEKYPEKAWDLNMSSLFHVLNLAKDGVIESVFWPSSIAVFGNSTPKTSTPQQTITEPSTVYGISKLAGERWCEYYKSNFNVDVRSVRYPGIISWKTMPGGGTTDYAVEIYHKAIVEGEYECFLSKNTRLPMMYMEDAIKATVDLMDVEKTDRYTAYNIAAIDFSPQDITEEIQKHIPNFKISYQPDFRQKIADSWPQSMDDSQARNDWNWEHSYDLKKMTQVMLSKLQLKYAKK